MLCCPRSGQELLSALGVDVVCQDSRHLLISIVNNRGIKISAMLMGPRIMCNPILRNLTAVLTFLMRSFFPHNKRSTSFTDMTPQTVNYASTGLCWQHYWTTEQYYMYLYIPGTASSYDQVCKEKVFTVQIFLITKHNQGMILIDGGLVVLEQTHKVLLSMCTSACAHIQGDSLWGKYQNK